MFRTSVENIGSPSDSDENESKERKEPKTSSTNPKERITARTIRITKRKECITRQETLIAGRFEELDEEEPIGIVEKQVAECTALLEHMLHDGDENVTNVRVANDAREIARRFTEAQKKRELLVKLEDEAKLAQEKFNEISSRWNIILELNEPLNIESEINSQKERCQDLLLQKNAIIEDLKQELVEADKLFYKDLDKQLNDVKELGERIDSQVILMKNAYRSQLELIEYSIEIDRANTINKNEKYWNDLYLQRDSDEVENTEKKLLKISEFKKNMENLMLEHKEKYRATKIQLENEIQMLQRELQELKASCLINTEKMDYTFYLLRRREEENASVKSQQKRRLNKMQDAICELKSKIKEMDKSGCMEKNKAQGEINKIQSSLCDLQRKDDYFAMANDRKYQQVWKMNKDKAKILVKKINQIDKIIHEEVLGIDWTPPKLNLLNQSDLPSFKNATSIDSKNSKMDKRASNTESESSSSSSENMQCEMVDEYGEKLTGHMLQLIANSTEFLIEDRLWTLLEKHQTDSVNLCKIDNIFNALNITSENDVEMIKKYFIKYAYCKECNKKDTEKDKQTQDDNEVVVEDLEEQVHDGNFIINEEKSTKDKISIALNSQCENGHPLVMDPSYTLDALQDFIAKFKIKKEAVEDKPVIVSRNLSLKDVTQYWHKYKEAFPQQKEKMWDNLTVGLTKYLPILQERHKLNESVIQLRKQNSELKNLLRGHAPSREVPKQKYLAPLNTPFE